MKRTRDLERRLRSLTALGEAVGAMKSLSAHHFREVRGAVDAAHVYRRGVEQLVAETGAHLPAGDGPVGLLIIGAELGLCGGYNARVVAAGAARRAALGAGPTFCIGRRAATALRVRGGQALERAYGAPTSVGGIPDLLLRLAEDVLTTAVAVRLSAFEVVSQRFAGVGAGAPTTVRLLPLESAPARAARPARYVGRDRLAAAGAREFLYITLYDLLLDAIAAEHAARLVATQSAEQWLSERRDGLRRRLLAARREASTQEVIEITAAARARTRW